MEALLPQCGGPNLVPGFPYHPMLCAVKSVHRVLSGAASAGSPCTLPNVHTCLIPWRSCLVSVKRLASSRRSLGHTGGVYLGQRFWGWSQLSPAIGVISAVVGPIRGFYPLLDRAGRGPLPSAGFLCLIL